MEESRDRVRAHSTQKEEDEREQLRGPSRGEESEERLKRALCESLGRRRRPRGEKLIRSCSMERAGEVTG